MYCPSLHANAPDVIDSPAMTTTTAGVVTLYVAARTHELSTETITTMACNLRHFASVVDDPPARHLSKSHVEHWLRTAKLAPSTMRTRLSQLRCFSGWAVEHGYMRKDPTLGVRGPRQPRRLPRGLKLAEVQAVLAHASDDRARLIVLLMVQEGLRRKEVAGLSLGDIDMAERTMLIVGKGDNERVLPVSDETWQALTAYLATGRIVGGPVIRSLRDGRSAIQPGMVGRVVSRTMLAAGVKERAYDGRSGHSCRHTAATDSLRAGAHVRDVQRMLGHVNLSSTQVYLPLVVHDLRAAMGGRQYT